MGAGVYLGTLAPAVSDRKYFEDLPVGSRFGGCSYAVERDEMIAFARKWDPRDIHLEDAAGRAAGFDGVIATGAYTTAIFTRLIRESRERDGDHVVIAGLGSEMKLLKPVRPGDLLRYDGEVIAARLSANRPGTGVLDTLGTLTNQRGEVVYEARSQTLVRCRTAAPVDA